MIDKKLINELKTCDEILYGLELSSRECHEIAEYIETLEKALDLACERLTSYYERMLRNWGFDPIEIEQSLYTPEEWKEKLFEMATDKEVKE